MKTLQEEVSWIAFTLSKSDKITVTYPTRIENIGGEDIGFVFYSEKEEDGTSSSYWMEVHKSNNLLSVTQHSGDIEAHPVPSEQSGLPFDEGLEEEDDKHVRSSN